MLRLGLAVMLLALGALGVVVAVHLLAQAAVMRAMRRRGAGCPFEDDDHRPLPLAAAVGLAIGESLRLVAACFGSLRPLPQARGSGTPVALLLAPPLPCALMRGLARHLGAAGRPTVVLRTPRWHFDEHAAARLASAIERTRGTAPVLDVLAYGASAPFVLRLLATSLGAKSGVRAVVAVGGRLGTAAAPPHVELVSIYSLDDAWLQPPDAGRHSDAFNVALRAEGHFSLLGSARALEIVLENLAHCDRAAGPRSVVR
jgi:hypothetical protein